MSAEEIRQVFRHRSVLWLGDSTARRTSANLYQILNDTKHTFANMSQASVIDVNKKRQTEVCQRRPFNESNVTINFCRSMPGGDGTFTMASAACSRDVEFIADHWSQWRGHVDLIVIDLGIWECTPGYRRTCRVPNETMYQVIDRVVLTLPLDEVEVIWRTTGYSAEARTERSVDALNEYVKNKIRDINHPNLTYFDWSAAVRERSIGDDRLVGDLKPHYGLEPRLVAIQMLANTLRDRHGVPSNTSVR